MTGVFDRPPVKVPEPEGSDAKEVYAFFGLCAYFAQVLERGLINLAVILNARGITSVTRRAVEDAFDRAEHRTLGQLIADVRRKVDVPPDLESALNRALDDRNFLMHRFFAVHDTDFASTAGRRAMIAELAELTRGFQQTDGGVESMTLPLWAKIGITKEVLEREFQRMFADAEASDGSS
jgi:hypothetical protein